jgi:starvation-inducible DNA-binding protein
VSTVTLQAKLFRTGIALPEEARIHMVDLLNSILADACDLHSHLRHAHWNLKGPMFLFLHRYFDELSNRVLEHTDILAERIATLGGIANGTVRQIATASSLPQYDLDAVSGPDHLRALARRMHLLASRLRLLVEVAAQSGDVVTSDLGTELLRSLEHDLWTIEAQPYLGGN